ncbi:MAG: HD domain-containing phosphohydrolase [Oligoflexia bacterium]|nr:HD domain-containing phosphohydrolase [Oligoflexia bacterium]
MSQPKNQKSGKVYRLKPRTVQEDRELASLLEVGAALSAEHESTKILEMILGKATENTYADGGSIYLIERIKQDSIGGARSEFVPMLRFSHSLNSAATGASLKRQLLELNHDSIAGYVALTGQSIRIRDAYALPTGTPYKFNPVMDRMNKYRTKSVLAVPIKTNKGKILGVVQLVNKKRTYRRADDIPPGEASIRVPEADIIAFSEHDDKLMHTFASHAAVALENAKLTEDISNLFESFVKASVMAIEARDPSTSGHSDRVAQLTVRLAEVVDSTTSGILKDIRFSTEQIREIRYASLLHDFGKIGVREAILTKGQKLFPNELETVLLRLQTITSVNEARAWRYCAEKLVGHATQQNPLDPQAELGKSLWAIDQFRQQIDQIRRGILKANESQILDKDFDIIKLMGEIKRMSEDIGQKILDENEIVRLSVKRGTLSPQERVQIESHVSHTYDFLSQIAWTETLQNVPEIAHAHHEKLDGTGYPRKLKADQIPIQSRMMTISDIYDALTAFDRPYKKAVDNTRALDILHDEAKEGKLDKELLRIFIEARAYEVTHPLRQKKTG